MIRLSNRYIVDFKVLFRFYSIFSETNKLKFKQKFILLLLVLWLERTLHKAILPYFLTEFIKHLSVLIIIITIAIITENLSKKLVETQASVFCTKVDLQNRKSCLISEKILNRSNQVK